MSVEIETLDKVQKAVTVEVDQETFDKALNDAYKERKKDISIPGFRKGHVPRALIEQNYGKDFFYYDAAEKCIFPAYVEAVKAHEEELQPIAEPTFEVVQLEVGKPFIFKAIVDTKQDISLGEYKGIALEKVDTEVTDEMVMEELKHKQEQTALLEDIDSDDAIVLNGDVVTIDFSGKKDNIAFEGGTAEDYELAIGSNSFIPGFEEGVEGMKIGETKDLDLSFPENYHAEDLAGAEVVFTVTVKGIKRRVLVDLDDEFAKDVSEFDTLDEYKADIKADLKKTIEESSLNDYKNKLTEKVVADSDVVAPRSLVEKESENYLNDMKYSMQSQGIELEKYLELTGGSMDEMKKELDKRAEMAVKSTLVLESIAEKEGIEVEDEELEAEYDRLADIYGMEKDKIKQIFLMQGQGEAIRRNILLEKTIQLLLDNANIG